jgi:hypothetical protein
MHIAIILTCYVQFAQAAPCESKIGIVDYPPFDALLCKVPLLGSYGMTIAK